MLGCFFLLLLLLWLWLRSLLVVGSILGVCCAYLGGMLGYLGPMLAHIAPIMGQCSFMLGLSWADVEASWGLCWGILGGYVGGSCAILALKHMLNVIGPLKHMLNVIGPKKIVNYRGFCRQAYPPTARLGAGAQICWPAVGLSSCWPILRVMWA